MVDRTLTFALHYLMIGTLGSWHLGRHYPRLSPFCRIRAPLTEKNTSLKTKLVWENLIKVQEMPLHRVQICTHGAIVSDIFSFVRQVPAEVAWLL